MHAVIFAMYRNGKLEKMLAHFDCESDAILFFNGMRYALNCLVVVHWTNDVRVSVYTQTTISTTISKHELMEIINTNPFV